MGTCAPCNSPDFLRFNRVCHYGKSNVIRRLEVGLKYFYEWSLLGIGAWTDITIDMPTATGENASLLKVANTQYTEGRAWEGFRTAWNYETGINYVDTTGSIHNPIPPNIYVNNVLQSGNYEVNYLLGQVIFDSAISLSSTVKSSYSFKNVQVYISNEAPWYKELQYNSWIPDGMFTKDKGDWFVGGNHRVQMPCIVIESKRAGSKVPYALGGGLVWRKQDVFFHVIAEDKPMRDNLTDLILEEGDRCIQLFDTDLAAANLDVPLDFNGRFTGKMYPYLLENYCWATARSDNATLMGLNSFNCGLHDGVVKHTYSVIFSDLC